MVPDSPAIPSPATVRAVLEEEIAASQYLLEKQQGVWSALRLARPAVEVEAALNDQESALNTAVEASQARQGILAGREEFSAWLKKIPVREQAAFEELRKEARLLRMRIEDLTRRCAWLSARSSHWIDSQRARIGELASKSLGPGTYGSRPGVGPRPSESSSPSLFDRSA